jgi:DNA-directed RNA polymerase subunit RPC12/RpoP
MASTAARGALSRAVGLLPERDRNLLTMHGRGGTGSVMDFLRCDRAKADAELARVKEKLAPVVQRELKRPPELPASSSLGPPERITLGGDRPLLRSRGEIKASTPPAKRKVPDYRAKPCSTCGEEFKPTAGRQMKCDRCSGRAIIAPPAEPPAPVTTRVDAPAPAPAPAPAASNGHGPAKEYARLRDKLRAIQGQIDNLAAGLDRLIEDQHTTRAGGRSDDP